MIRTRKSASDIGTSTLPVRFARREPCAVSRRDSARTTTPTTTAGRTTSGSNSEAPLTTSRTKDVTTTRKPATHPYTTIPVGMRLRAAAYQSWVGV